MESFLAISLRYGLPIPGMNSWAATLSTLVSYLERVWVKRVEVWRGWIRSVDLGYTTIQDLLVSSPTLELSSNSNIE
jgi:hypothetical protein